MVYIDDLISYIGVQRLFLITCMFDITWHDDLSDHNASVIKVKDSLLIDYK